jgi:hypothetical protein
MEISETIEAKLAAQGLELIGRWMPDLFAKCLDSFFIGLVYANAKTSFKSIQIFITE